MACAQCADEGGGRGHVGGKFLRVYVQKYYGAQFIAPIQGPILNFSPDTSSAGDW